MKDFELRPYRLRRLDSMFNDKHLTELVIRIFRSNQMILTDEYAGLCLMYQAIHGEEDKRKYAKSSDEEEFIKNPF